MQRVIVYVHCLPVRDVFLPTPRVRSEQSVGVVRSQLTNRLGPFLQYLSEAGVHPGAPSGPPRYDFLLSLQGRDGRVHRPIVNQDECLADIRGFPPITDLVYRCDVLPAHTSENTFVILHHTQTTDFSTVTPHAAVMNLEDGSSLTCREILSALADEYDRYAALREALLDIDSPARRALEYNLDGSWPVFRGRDYAMHTQTQTPARADVLSWPLCYYDRPTPDRKVSGPTPLRDQDIARVLLDQKYLACVHPAVPGWKVYDDVTPVTPDAVRARECRELALT